MAPLTHAEMQDCLSWRFACVRTPVWQRSLHSTPRLLVMGLAASKSWISQGISCGNTDESPILRGRETVLEAFDINCKDMRMLSARTSDKLRAISEVARKGRRVKNSPTDRRNSRMESRIHREM